MMNSLSLDNKRKTCLIQIDTDALWVVFQHFGIQHDQDKDILYESALPRFLDIFDCYNIKATFFVVGRDLLYPERLLLLKEVIKRGHEIANHTMTHAEGFSFLSYRDKIKEIEDSERIIADTLGVLTKGFRTPGNDVDGETLRILEGRGYIYDSSLMPTYYGPIFKLLKFSSSKITRKNHYLGRPAYGLSPLSPYHPDGKKIWKRGDMNLLEIPITTMPCLRIPFHASFTFATYQLGFGIALFDMGYRLLKATNLPLNFVFHTNELSDPVKDSRIRRQYGLSLPLEDKYRICRRILDAIHKDFTFKTTTEYAITYEK